MSAKVDSPYERCYQRDEIRVEDLCGNPCRLVHRFAGYPSTLNSFPEQPECLLPLFPLFLGGVRALLAAALQAAGNLAAATECVRCVSITIQALEAQTENEEVRRIGLGGELHGLLKLFHGVLGILAAEIDEAQSAMSGGQEAGLGLGKLIVGYV